ncbi:MULTISPECIES: SHOCT domain-containing protein [unclassified Streptomyces]|uniref:SHOCT domain-containing protein n=1 Tax=unclassified Streptomyces TaxID=2593676 RepID=UPI00380978C9
MNTLAYAGPGPWILFVPLVWAAVILTVVTVLRRAGWRGRRGPWRPPVDDRSPLAVLGRRFASGEIDEEEYWRRISVLEEHFGRTDITGTRKGGAA